MGSAAPGLEMFNTRRVAVVAGDRATAETLHTFFGLMQMECCLVSHLSDAVSALARFRPDVLLLDLDLPDLRAMEIAREVHALLPDLPIIYLTDFQTRIDVTPVIAKPHGRFEDLLRLFEVVLAAGE